jgi:hypothetical protein
MNNSFNIEHFKILAAGFVVDNLNPEENAEFHLLLNQHPELISEVEDLQGVLKELVDGFIEVEPPANLLSKIMIEAELKPVGEIEQNQTPAIVNKSPQWIKFVGAFAALLIVTLLMDNYQLRNNLAVVNDQHQKLTQDLEKIQEIKSLLQSPKTRLVTLESMNNKHPNYGSIIINPQKQKAVIMFENLAAPPPGKVYLLWTIIANEKLPCGEVKPYSWGKITHNLPFTDQMYQEFSHPQFSGLIITLERDPQVSRPTGAIVMQSNKI